MRQWEKLRIINPNRDWKGKNKLCKWQKSKGSGANSIIEKQEIEHGYGKNCKNEKLT